MTDVDREEVEALVATIEHSIRALTPFGSAAEIADAYEQQGLAALARLHSALLRAKEERDELREALEFYADERTYTQPTSWGGRIMDDEGPWSKDCGARARSALATPEETKEAGSA